MISEAIKTIQGLAQEAQTAKILPITGLPDHLYAVATPTGTIEIHELKPASRLVYLDLIDDLIAMGRKHFDDSINATGRMTCFYSETEVRLVFDHTRGREAAVVKLQPTSEYEFFLRRTNTPLIEVKDLRQALRVQLRKCYSDSALIDQVSSLAFTNTDQGSVTADRGKESLGRALLQQVEKPDQLPDPYQEFAVRKYGNSDLDVRYGLQCLLDPDTATRRWLLQPLEDSWIQFNADNMELIGNQLRNGFANTSVRVFQGLFLQPSPSSDAEG